MPITFESFKLVTLEHCYTKLRLSCGYGIEGFSLMMCAKIFRSLDVIKRVVASYCSLSNHLNCS